MARGLDYWTDGSRMTTSERSRSSKGWNQIKSPLNSATTGAPSLDPKASKPTGRRPGATGAGEKPNATPDLFDQTATATAAARALPAKRSLHPWDKSLTQLAASVLADRPSLNGDDAGVWQPPAVPLPLQDLVEAIAHLEARTIAATAEEYLTCMDAMGATLPARAEDALTWDKRLEIYQTALADLPPDLLEAAALECIKTEKFFPSVATIREKIEAEFKKRSNMLHRALWLQANRTQAPARQAFVPEPEDVRLRATIARWRKHADSFMGHKLRLSAMGAEMRLAEIEGRAPEDWAIEQSTKPSPAPISQPPRPPAAPPTIEGDFSRVETDSKPTQELEW